MTKQKTFKRRVRERMDKTGESYTAARRVLIADGVDSDPPLPMFEPPTSEDALARATGEGWPHWIGVLDAWGAPDRSHRQIALWLREEQGVPGWWAQAIAVGWERARGLRAPGQRAGGWAVSASRTIAVPVEALHAAFSDEAQRERWLPGADMRLRKANLPRSLRFDWEDGATRVVVGFEDAGPAKSRVALEHERLPDADAVAATKAFWRERLTALKAQLEEA